MKYNPEKHRRQSIRLPGHDYSQAGMYFITVCTRDRDCLFGDVVDGEMRLSPAGEIIRNKWVRSAAMRPRMTLDTFVVMPNHLHGIISLGNDPERGGAGRGRRAPA